MNDTAKDVRVDPAVIDAIHETLMCVRHFVNHPDDVQVNVECRGYSVLADLRTHKKDVGQVIGKNAHLINSIRSFLSAIGGKNNVQIMLDFVTEEDNRRNEKSGGGRNVRGQRHGGGGYGNR
jgi:predicted RNA-binding protein YlqC (UPF0109 family)